MDITMAKPADYFSKEIRDSACCHEAAHAVIFSLGGTLVKKIMVHAVGAEADCDSYVGYGSCFIEEYFLEDLSTTQARAYACGVLAGYIAESMLVGKMGVFHPGSDTETFKIVMDSLPGGERELSNLKNETMRALDLFWDRMILIAKLLEKYGEVDFESDKKYRKLLPPPFSGIKKWPSVPNISTIK
ncbi:MAG: hypothetical protein HGB32_14970 [Geobacteraceae bacterium]|nr:hypothetical protein [Geobacteraceae bacterium]NTW81427.1 hypothetical protein [Geobacteraceae bacterium]